MAVKAQDIYESLVKAGRTQKDAAKEAQARTGMSLVSGKPIKRTPKFSKRTGKVIGQYG